jgi:hypothetical protein
VGYPPRFAVAPIEDGPFLQVDSAGSKPVLMPSGECVGYGWRMSVNIYPGYLFASFVSAASHTSHLSKTRWDI